MNPTTSIPLPTGPNSEQPNPVFAVTARPTAAVGTSRVLRNTYALLSMTLLFSAAIAAASVAFQLPAPGPAVAAMVALLSAGLILYENQPDRERR